VAAVAGGSALLVSADVRHDRERLGRIEGELLELQDLVRSCPAPPAPPADAHRELAKLRSHRVSVNSRRRGGARQQWMEISG
jgi:hypothetical protein